MDRIFINKKIIEEFQRYFLLTLEDLPIPYAIIPQRHGYVFRGFADDTGEIIFFPVSRELVFYVFCNWDSPLHESTINDQPLITKYIKEDVPYEKNVKNTSNAFDNDMAQDLEYGISSLHAVWEKL